MEAGRQAAGGLCRALEMTPAGYEHPSTAARPGPAESDCYASDLTTSLCTIPCIILFTFSRVWSCSTHSVYANSPHFQPSAFFLRLSDLHSLSLGLYMDTEQGSNVQMDVRRRLW